MAKRKTTRKTSNTLDDPPPLSLSKRSAELLAELSANEKRDRSEILNDAIMAYAKASTTRRDAKPKAQRR